jgi:hypothetical protein
MTSYAIEGSKYALDRIYDALENHDVKEGSAQSWVGNVLLKLGIKIDGARVRAFYYSGDAKIDNGTLKINLEEAWCRQDFAELIEKKFPSTTVYWIAEEGGCQIYETNDSKGKYFPERYWVDACVNGEYDSQYFEVEEDAFKWVSELAGVDLKTQKDVERWNINAEDVGDFVYIYKFEVL